MMNGHGSRLAKRAGQAGMSRVQNLVQNLDQYVKQDVVVKTETRPKREVEQLPREVNEYQCPMCKKKLQCQARVLEHIAAVHEEQRIYDCFFCDVTYKYKSNLRAHIKKKHTSEMKCPKCPNRVFVKFDVLVKHLMEAHNDKSQAPLKFWNYDTSAEPIETEKKLDKNVPIARKTITHKSNDNAPADKRDPNEPPRRNIAFKTIVPLRQTGPSGTSTPSSPASPSSPSPVRERPKIVIKRPASMSALHRRPIEDIISTYSKPSPYSNPASNASSTSSLRSYGSSGVDILRDPTRGAPNPHINEQSMSRYAAMLPKSIPDRVKRPAEDDPDDPFYGLGPRHEPKRPHIQQQPTNTYAYYAPVTTSYGASTSYTYSTNQGPSGQ